MEFEEIKEQVKKVKQKIKNLIVYDKETEKGLIYKIYKDPITTISGITALVMSLTLLTSNTEKNYRSKQNENNNSISSTLNPTDLKDTSYAYYEEGVNSKYEPFYMLNFNLKFDENGKLVGNYIEDIHNILENDQTPIGIVIKLQDYSLADVYLAIDEIKKIIEYYNVNFPIYYDVDSILNQEKYKNDKYAYINNYKMMNAFIDKCVYNGMFIGIAGSAENITKYREEFIKDGKKDLYYDTDKLVHTSPEQLEQYQNDATIGMIECNGFYYSKKDYEQIIQNYGYNSGLSFKDDFIHVIQPGESIGYLQDLYKITNRENLYRLNYNCFSDSRRVYTGYEIRIPMVLKEGYSNGKPSNVQNNNESFEGKKYYKGIDISKHNYIHDWQALSNSNQVDFAVLRLCNTYHTIAGNNKDAIDSRFKDHYDNCKKYGIKTSMYIYCQWYGGTLEEMKENARKEANHFVNYLRDNNYEPDLGVLFFDYEGSGSDGGFQKNTCEPYMIEAIMAEHKKIVEEAGYKYGFYSNQAVTRKIDMSKFNDVVYWVAGGSKYHSGSSYNIETLNTPTALTSLNCGYSYDPTQSGVAIQQITAAGIVPGTNKLTDVNLIPENWYNHLISVNEARISNNPNSNQRIR